MADQTCKIATWNINSVRLRQDQVLRFLKIHQPDVLCLQETKCPDVQFPHKPFIEAGYPHQSIAGMKGYNGVAILSRLPLVPLARRAFYGQEDARHIAAAIGEGAQRFVIHNLYVPAGGDVPDPQENQKFAHKLAFVAEMEAFSREIMAQEPRAVLVGDLNIAPLEQDVWSHKQLLDVVSHTPVETTALQAVLQAGAWCDALRVLYPEPQKLYSWWSYRSPDWEKADKGRRLDHVWLSAPLAPSLVGGAIIKETRGWERPSDHVPVIVEIKLGE